jgi:glycosyltransferase involved in cell wall biosynthesis
MNNKITVNIITLNEENNIEAAIESVRKIADEIIVVDSFSTDKTCELASSLGAIVIKQKYLGDGAQKAFVTDHAKNDWILSLDADERLDIDAISEIKKLNLSETQFDSFSFARKTYIGKKFIKLWYPDRVTRLYNKSKCGFSIIGGHSKVEGKFICDLNAHMLHYSYTNYSEMIKTSHKFINRGAKLSFESGKRAKKYDPFLHGIGALFKALILKGGLFHGVDGFNVAIVSSFSSYMKYALMIELEENSK